MLDSIITSKTRIQILLRFFTNPENRTYLRELAADLGESSNAVRIELNRLSKTHLIRCVSNGRTKCYQANREHPMFRDLHSIVKKTLGIDKLIDDIIGRLGDVKLGFIVGDYARGIDSGIVDLILVGAINLDFLQELIQKVEHRFGNRKIRCLALTEEEYGRFGDRIRQEKHLYEIYRQYE